jgi:hypothetical protein
MMILKDTGVYDRVVEIGIEAMTETMKNNSKVFLSAVLNDLFASKPGVKTEMLEEKKSVATEQTRKPTRPGMKRKASVTTDD